MHEHVTALRQRVGEMREPPLGLDVVPDLALEQFFDEILATPTTAELLVGIYEVALPALGMAIDRHKADTNPLTDAPQSASGGLLVSKSTTCFSSGKLASHNSSTVRRSRQWRRGSMNCMPRSRRPVGSMVPTFHLCSSAAATAFGQAVCLRPDPAP